MKDRYATITKLNTQIVQCKGRLKWPIILLVLQGLICWIRNPGFIPFLTEEITAVQEFLLDFLLPHGVTDTESYRHYIGLLCDWVKGLPFYPALTKIAPWIIPGWLLLTLLRLLILRWRYNYLRRPRKEPKEPTPKKTKKPAEKSAADSVSQALRPKATESGLFLKHRLDAEKRFQELQNSCVPRQCKDRGIWLSNFSAVNDEVPPDRILHWSTDGSAMLAEEHTFRFELIDGKAYIVGNLGKIPMKKGVPYTLEHMNDAGKSITYCRATWLGGI